MAPGSLAATPTTVRCRLAGSQQRRAVRFDAFADGDAAQQWISAFRRVQRVDLRACPEGWDATVTGLGHRLPVTRRLPLTAALGMTHHGIPVVVHLEDPR